MASFDVGDTWSPQIKITDNGVAADPASLTLKVRTPAGVITTYVYPDPPIVKDSPGVYHADIVLTAPGVWTAQWETTAPAQVQASRVDVDPSPVDTDPFAPPVWTPELAQVGALNRARTKDANGNELGTFTTVTRPTAAEVLILIDLAVAELQARVDRSFQLEYTAAARNVAALRCCMHIERGYFPEQTESRDSAYARFAREYDGAATELLAAVTFPSALRLV